MRNKLAGLIGIFAVALTVGFGATDAVAAQATGAQVVAGSAVSASVTPDNDDGPGF